MRVVGRCVENHGTYNGDTVTWDTGSHEAARGGRLGEAYGEEVAAVSGVGEDGEGVGVRDGGGDGGEVVVCVGKEPCLVWVWVGGRPSTIVRGVDEDPVQPPPPFWFAHATRYM
jgi:hypothetical protein